MKIVLVLATALHGVGLFWGLPASDAWDNDGIAPRDILPGLAATFTPGDFYTYPPFHLALLAVLTLPVTIVAVARAPSTSVSAVVKEILAPGYMTAFTATARVVSLLMSLGLAIAIAKLAEEIFAEEGERERGERVGVLAAAIVSAGICVTYYAHMSNLDIPALFWGSISALMLVRAIRRREVRLIRRAALFAVLAVSSKDQAYALFVVSAPLLLGGWLLADDDWVRANRRVVLREVGIALALSAALLLLVDGAITNPSGFRARLAFLRGPASQDFSGYAKDVEGRFALLVDLGRRLTIHYPPVFGLLIVGGLVLCLVQASRGTMLLRLAPLIFALSFTIGFNMAARRTDDRFTLPQAVFAAIYAAYAIEWMWSRFASGGLMVVLRLACAGVLVLEAWEAMRVDLTLLFEPRLRTEAFLAANVRVPDDTIEVHGLNVYLPRFPAGARVVRVGQNRRRGPLPGVDEVEAPLMDIERRRPRWVVISMCYAWRFLEKNVGAHEGRIYPESQLREAHDVDATRFFEGMYAERLGYRIVDDQKIPPNGYGWFRPIEIHASLNCRTTTWERSTR